MRALVLADTHMGPSRPGRHLPDRVYELLDGVDVVLHAGDVTAPSLLYELEGFAPVHAVLGNNDVELRLPERLELDLGGVRVAMIHDSGARTGREGRMRRRFPDADVVVFGHSHMPLDAEGVDGQRLFNPGSPTQRRRQPEASFGILEVEGGRLVGHEVVRFS